MTLSPVKFTLGNCTAELLSPLLSLHSLTSVERLEITLGGHGPLGQGRMEEQV